MLRTIMSAFLIGFIFAASGAIAYTEGEKPMVSNHKQLTSVRAMKGYAEWSTDGKYIIY